MTFVKETNVVGALTVVIGLYDVAVARSSCHSTVPARRVDIDGRGVEVLDLPAENHAPALVLLHEGLGSVGLWRRFPAALRQATGARVVAFSRFGHGDSDPPERPRRADVLHAEEALSVLPRLLASLGIERPVLVGHSDGASIALIHATAHPVAAVVAIAPHVFVEEPCLAEIRSVRNEYENGDLRSRMARHHRDPDAAFYGWSDVWLDPGFRAWNIEHLLPQAMCPLLLIQGEQDQFGTMAQLDAIEARAGGPVERVHLPCRHSPHREELEATVQATSAFVRRITGPPGAADRRPR